MCVARRDQLATLNLGQTRSAYPERGIMALPVSTMNGTDRDILARYGDGHRISAIAHALDLEVPDVQDTIRTLTRDDRTTARELVAAYDRYTAQAALPAAGQDTPDSAGNEPQQPPAAPAEQPASPSGPEVQHLLDRAAAEQRAVAGDREELPATGNAEQLLAAAEAVTGAADVFYAAREARVALGELGRAYDRERRRRELRNLVGHHREQLDSCLAELAALEDQPADAAGIPSGLGESAPEGITNSKNVRDAIRAWAVRTRRRVGAAGLISRELVEEWWEAEGRHEHAPAA